jgi:hypothetical protein
MLTFLEYYKQVPVKPASESEVANHLEGAHHKTVQGDSKGIATDTAKEVMRRAHKYRHDPEKRIAKVRDTLKKHKVNAFHDLETGQIGITHPKRGTIHI